MGKVGGLALAYFLVMSTFALGIGLVVGNLIKPGTGLGIAGDPGAGAELAGEAHAEGGTMEFISDIIPDTLFSVADRGQRAAGTVRRAAGRVRNPGAWERPASRCCAALSCCRSWCFASWSVSCGRRRSAPSERSPKWSATPDSTPSYRLAVLMLAFYLTCIIFVFGVLGTLLRIVARVSVFKLVRYLAREYLLIVATSSSESALPRLIAKMEHAGVQPATVGIVVPTGYSFNLDGTAIYMTMASLFIADAMGDPLSIREQLSLLAVHDGRVQGCGRSQRRRVGDVGRRAAEPPARTARRHRPDRRHRQFMSEARALTNFSGNAIATVLIGAWTSTLDHRRMHQVLDGDKPFDERTMVDDDTARKPTRQPTIAIPPRPAI